LLLRAARITRAKPAYLRGVPSARKDIDASGMQLAPRVPDDAFESIEDTRIASVPVRIYRPRDISAGAASALLYFHGGGHTIGSLASHHGVCRATSAGARCTVIAVDYRLAPEHPFPAAADDATAVFRAAVAQADALRIDRARIGVCGDSAGGNLAAVVALDTIDDDAPPRLQVLVYPVVDQTMSSPSIESLAHGFMLEKETIAWYRAHYMGAGADDAQGVHDARLRNPRASPLFAPDEKLARTPPAIIVTAGFDPLRDEGNAYAAKLARVGVRVEHIECAGMFHGFWNTTGAIHAARQAFDDVTARIARSLRS
jgi:acetyl esterase